MNLSRPAIALYMGLVFLSGAVLGVFGNRYYASYSESKNNNKGKRDGRRPMTPEEFRARSIEFMQKRLNLTHDQVIKLGLIYDETRANFDQLQRRMQPEQEAIGKTQTDRIRAILNDEQKAEYEKMRKEREEFNKRKGNKGFGPGF